MALRLNTRLIQTLVPPLILVGTISVLFIGISGFLSFVNEDYRQKENQNILKKKANDISESFYIKKQDLTNYSIAGPNTLRVDEAGIIYRFNFDAEIISIRSNLDDVQRTDQFSIMSFNELSNPVYIEKLKDIGCQISVSASEKFNQYDISIYSKDSQEDIRNTFSIVQKFGELYCEHGLRR